MENRIEIEKNLNKEFDSFYEKCKTHLISLALEVLRSRPELDEFIMAMGTAFFTYKKKEHHLDFYKEYRTSYNYRYEISKPFLKPLVEFYEKWNGTLKLSGDAMRFKSDGEITTDW